MPPPICPAPRMPIVLISASCDIVDLRRWWMRCALYHGLALAAACAPKPEERAMSLARQGREADAIVILRKDLLQHPADVGARRLLVRLLADSGDMSGAK